MDEKVKALSDYRLEKAKKNIEVAEKLLKDGYADVATNRAYYAVFDAMRAVNALDEFDSSKHSGVIAHFNQYHVKNGDFSPDTSAIIRKAANMREKSDYEDFYESSIEDAAEILREAKEFVERVRIFLETGQE